ncbi:MAG: type II toxin-antitoxin system HicA family toxin [Planctomycetes bacterium]|nr:type II toxin-antitoxin system HicA family toxin [Planctomycetota bacterium]
MKAITGKELARALRRKGWSLKRVTGSHHIFGREGSVVRLSVPIHANRPRKRGLLAHLLKLAGLSEQDV